MTVSTIVSALFGFGPRASGPMSGFFTFFFLALPPPPTFPRPARPGFMDFSYQQTLQHVMLVIRTTTYNSEELVLITLIFCLHFSSHWRNQHDTTPPPNTYIQSPWYNS